MTSGVHHIRREIDTIWSNVRDLAGTGEDEPDIPGTLQCIEKAIFSILQSCWMTEDYIQQIERAAIDARRVANGQEPIYGSEP
jgi:hypothetical protein